MRENKLIDLSINFAVEVVNLCNTIKGNSVLINQLIRSGTSIGANIHEANYAHSKADFIAKLQIALKECYESEYWIILLERTSIISSEQVKDLKNHCGNIRRILIASINTAKDNKDRRYIT
jgi:four helix bundle protein